MRFRNALLTIFALCGSNVIHGQSLLTDLTSIDPDALAAVQTQVTVEFGAGTSVGKGNPYCPQQVGTSGECAASVVMTIPPPVAGATYRLVITNISATLSYNGSTADLPQQCLTLQTVLNAASGGTSTVAPTCLPFTQTQTTGSYTNYYLSQSVHMYTDLDADFPTFSIINLKGIGPIFTTGGGALNIGVQGYLVKTS